jgi:hypothetical protein
VRHARDPALDEIDDLLAALRSVPGLTERSRGVFYRRGRAFLHFHEDPSGLHADLRVHDEFDRCRVATKAERAGLLRRVRAAAG